jgi:hypothetical protein
MNQDAELLNRRGLPRSEEHSWDTNTLLLGDLLHIVVHSADGIEYYF